MIKKCGQKNELTDNEIKFWEDNFQGEYQIGKQIGVTGMKTSAYLATNKAGEKYILKIANNPDNSDWGESQKKAIAMRNEMLKDYRGEIVLPEEISVGSNYIIETYGGVEFTSDVYENMTNEGKDKVVDDMANFLNFIHQKSISLTVSPLNQVDNPTLDVIKEYLNMFLNPQEKEYFEERIRMFKNRDIDDEITVNIHRDLRSQNVLYNSETRKLAVIDFELATTGNIYYDFVPSASASFGMSYDFLFRVVACYNHLEKQEPIFIDPQKVRLLHEVGVFHEYGRVAKHCETKDSQLKYIVDNRIMPMINDIDSHYKNSEIVK